MNSKFQEIVASEQNTNKNYKNNTEEDINPSFLSLLCNEIPFDYKLKKYKIRKTPSESILYEIDDSHRFRNTVSITKTGNSTIQALSSSSRNSAMRDFMIKKQIDTDLEKQYNENFNREIISSPIIAVDIVDWENEIFFEAANDDIGAIEYINELLDGKWEKNIFLDPKEMNISKKFITLNINDPNLILEKIDEKKAKMKKKISKLIISEKPLKNKFNVSNDKYYITEIKSKASLGTFGVQHSLPALKLDHNFYKTNHSKEELRSFHRAQCILANKEYFFKPVSKSKFVGSIIKKGHELTLSDLTPMVIFEYYEEYPFFIVNPGMVSLMNTYYRKLDSSDEPPNDNFISLEPEDEAPFFGFGDIKPGAQITTLTNNLFISPIFKHKNNDFLCVIYDDNIILRPIQNIYLVGQEFPKEEVFAPHSRKLNHFCKDRLKVAAYRIFNKGIDLQMQQLDQMFPYFSEGSKRKWLKEYSDCIKKGRDNVWVLKDKFSIIGEEDLRKLVTPENICQYESMLATERRMQDLGYKCVETEDDDQDYGSFTPSWHLSRNFINAANGRGLLELNGSADLSNNGESFSFRKIKLKKGNESENRRIINEQQSSYKERIETIWNKQLEILNCEDLIEHNIEKKKEEIEIRNEMPETEECCIIIKRTYKKEGNFYTKVVKLHDQKLIRAYLKARKRNKSEDRKPPLTCSSCGQSGHMKTNKSCPNFVGVLKSTRKKTEETKKPSTAYQEKLLKLISNFMAIPFSGAFHRPVSTKKFPNYKNIVKNPIDLGTIKSNVKERKYLKFSDFLSDLSLMRDNCAAYNGTAHSLTEIAENICLQASEYYNLHDKEIIEYEEYMKNERNDENNIKN